ERYGFAMVIGRTTRTPELGAAQAATAIPRCACPRERPVTVGDRGSTAPPRPERTASHAPLCRGHGAMCCRAQCPQPALDDRLQRSFPDGRSSLVLSLDANGSRQSLLTGM